MSAEREPQNADGSRRGVAPTVLVTRAAHQSSALAAALRRLGANPVLIPAIDFADPTSFAALDHAVSQLATFDWLLFTSANAVEAMSRRYGQGSGVVNGLGVFRGPKLAAIGPGTARALEALGRSPELIPPQAVAESLTAALLPLARQPDGRPTRFLLVRAEQAREHLPEALREAGAEVIVAPAYRTVVPAASVEALRGLFGASDPMPLDAITFTSASAARNLLALFEAAGVAFPPEAVRGSIGPITSAALRELGYPPHVETAAASVEELAEKVLECWSARAELTREGL